MTFIDAPARLDALLDPVRFSGRLSEMAAFQAWLGLGTEAPVLVFEGLVGMGRSALLGRLRAIAGDRGFAASTPVAIRPGSAALHLAGHAAASIEAMVGTDRARWKGSILIFDDANHLTRRDLGALLAGVAQLRGITLVLSGLPGLGRSVEAASPVHGAQVVTLGRLSNTEARQAIVHGPWNDEAAMHLAWRADGVPAFLRIRAEALLHEAAGGPVDLALLDGAELTCQARLRDAFFLPALVRVTRTERAYLAVSAMCADTAGTFSSGEVEARLLAGRASRIDGGLRRGLLSKGVLFSPAWGRLAFAHPGMAAHLRAEALR